MMGWPDYLIDVTAVAECFKDTGTEALLHLLKRFTPFETSVPLMLGNIANYFFMIIFHIICRKESITHHFLYNNITYHSSSGKYHPSYLQENAPHIFQWLHLISETFSFVFCVVE